MPPRPNSLMISYGPTIFGDSAADPHTSAEEAVGAPSATYEPDAVFLHAVPPGNAAWNPLPLIASMGGTLPFPAGLEDSGSVGLRVSQSPATVGGSLPVAAGAVVRAGRRGTGGVGATCGRRVGTSDMFAP